MNIIEAIKSGKHFKRPCHVHWRIGGNITYGSLNISKMDAIADDWEIQQEPRKVTLHQYLYEQSGYIKLSIETSMKFDIFCSFHLGTSDNIELLKTFTREIEL